MKSLELYYSVLVTIQLFHSLEEILTHFEKRWPLWKMPRWFFVLFEIIFSAFITLLVFAQSFPYRSILMEAFILLMFVNGIWHSVWAIIERKYVPGIVTAPFAIVTFILFYFQLL